MALQLRRFTIEWRKTSGIFFEVLPDKLF